MSFEPVPFRDDTDSDLDAIRSVRDRVLELEQEGVKIPALTLPATRADVPEAVEAPLGYLTVKTLRWKRIPDGQLPSEGGTGVLWLVRDGYDVTLRPRTPEDDLAVDVVTIDTPQPALAPPAAAPEESWEEWRTWVLNRGANGQTARDARVAGPGSRQIGPRPTNLLSDTAGSFCGHNRNTNV